MKDNLKVYILIFLIIIAIGLIFGMIVTIKKEGGKCMMNPLIYGVSQYKDMLCVCSIGIQSIFITNETITPVLVNPLK